VELSLPRAPLRCRSNPEPNDGLIGGPLMMLALVILGIAVGTMIAVLF
jgi:hypothetical protein